MKSAAHVPSRRLFTQILALAPLGLYLLILVSFALLSEKFLSVENLVNILVQSSAIAIVAIGMTFVLLTAGIDLSVGAIMFLAGAIAGSLVVRADMPVPLAFLVMLVSGCGCGMLNGLFITRLQMAPFIVTLAMLFFYRGAGLWITETRAINLPDAFRQIATARLAGIPSPVIILAIVLAAAHLILTRTSFGRQIYAVGNDAAGAEKAGLNVRGLLLAVYSLAGIGAALGGAISLAQLAAVDPKMGQGRELDAIAAAVLGGTSLFGGRGTAFGAVLGAVLIETVRNGLNILAADPYVYPVIIGAIIFVAVLLDSVRNEQLSRLLRRQIRPHASSQG